MLGLTFWVIFPFSSLQ